MLLDYVLGHFGEQFLETEQQKVKFFHEKLGIPLESLPQVTQGNRSHPRYFPDHFSVTVEQPDSNSLGYHLKTGHTLSLQNRPTGLA
jgi:hypothetical protein